MTLSLWRIAEDHVWIQDIGTRNCNTEVTLETPRSLRCQSCGVPAQKNQPKRKNCAGVNKAERSWRSEHSRKKVGDLKSALTSDMEMQFGDFQAGFWFCFGPVIPCDDILEW